MCLWVCVCVVCIGREGVGLDDFSSCFLNFNKINMLTLLLQFWKGLRFFISKNFSCDVQDACPWATFESGEALGCASDTWWPHDGFIRRKHALLRWFPNIAPSHYKNLLKTTFCIKKSPRQTETLATEEEVSKSTKTAGQDAWGREMSGGHMLGMILKSRK